MCDQTFGTWFANSRVNDLGTSKFENTCIASCKELKGFYIMLVFEKFSYRGKQSCQS